MGSLLLLYIFLPFVNVIAGLGLGWHLPSHAVSTSIVHISSLFFMCVQFVISFRFSLRFDAAACFDACRDGFITYSLSSYFSSCHYECH